jgi:hypothetical protein
MGSRTYFQVARRRPAIITLVLYYFDKKIICL